MADNVILVVDDEPNIRQIVRAYLENDGYTVIEAADGEEALQKARDANPDLIVLDLMMPKLDGREVFRRVRQFADTPIIMLTARGEELDRVLGLEMGADDYVSKPFSPRELVARIRAVLRRVRPAAGGGRRISQAGKLRIDHDARRVQCGGADVSLTPKEFDLLSFLVTARGRVCSREILLQNVWGYDYFGDVRTVDSHIRSLREKLGPECSKYLRTVWGVGYKFEVESDTTVSY